MNRVERQLIHELAAKYDAIAKGMILGEIEVDTASHWVTILTLHLRMNRMARADLYAWFTEEQRAMNKYLREKGLAK
jgi:hypothetical protein